MAQIVAANVFAVLDELDRMAEEGALVHARDKSFDGLLGAQIELGRPRNDGGIEKPARIVGTAWAGIQSLTV